MKCLITADWHLDSSTGGVRRFEDLKGAVLETVQAATNNKIDFYFVLGDLINPDAGSVIFSAIELVIRVAGELAKAQIRSYWLSGNHDVIEDGSGRTTITPLRSLVRLNPFVHPIESPSWFQADGEDTGFILLPYVARVSRYNPSSFVKTATDHLNIKNLVVLGHMTEIEGAMLGEETTDMARGRGIPFPSVPDGALLFNGHYHRHQKVKYGSHEIHIPGCLERLTFGEQSNQPGYIIAEV